MLAKLARGGRFSLRRLSFRNQLLVEAQSPGTTSVATYQAWQRAGRQVRKGVKALVILAPVIVDKAKTGNRDNLEDDGKKTLLVGFRPLATFAGNQTIRFPVMLAVRFLNLNLSPRTLTLKRLSRGTWRYFATVPWA